MRRPSTSAHAAGFLQRGWSALRGLTFASLAAATLAALLPAPVAAEQRTSRNDIVFKPAPAIPVVAVQFLQEESTEALVEHFAAAGYDLTAVLSGTRAVPRLYTTQLPDDLRALEETELRKEAFIGALLPLILMANEEILDARRELQRLVAKQAGNEALTAAEHDWLVDLADYYDSDPEDTGELLLRVDALPVALTLAQAIEESGWGTSRYARDGNALFGQRTWKKDVPGMTARKDGQTLGHKARAFADLMHSVRAYMHNLNSNRAFKRFREERAILREGGDGLDGKVLAGFLGRYAENETYAENLRRVIRHNELEGYEGARLATGTLAEALDGAVDPGS